MSYLIIENRPRLFERRHICKIYTKSFIHTLGTTMHHCTLGRAGSVLAVTVAGSGIGGFL